MKNKIGVEVEYILRNAKDEVIMPPSRFDRDDFPVLGEIRGEPGENVADVISNFIKEKIKLEKLLFTGHYISFEPVTLIPLKLYKKAMKEIRDMEIEKDALLSSIMNIYNTDISDYSDQIITNSKIQGCRASCGLHIHFSSEIREKKVYKKDKYTSVDLPLIMNPGKIDLQLDLYKHDGYKEEKTIEVACSQLNRPTVEWIVKELDKKFFDKFAPTKKDRTKFRQPGFFERKDYGFEYRSLPATNDTIEALSEIVSFAFGLLDKLDKFDYRKV